MATHCLHVGINDYQGRENDLDGCLNDTRDFKRLFGQRRRGAVRDAIDACPLFAAADTQIVITDRQATRKRMLAELLAWLRRLERGDWGILTYSGHGSYAPDNNGDEPDGHDEALVTWELDLILDDELGSLLEKRTTGTRVIILTDSCHSGTATRSIGPRCFGPPDENIAYRFLPPARIPRSKLKAAKTPRMKRSPRLIDVVHFAACKDNQFAADASFHGRPNGAFTYYFFDALQSLGQGATFGELRDAIAARLPSGEYDQEPQVNAFARALAWKIPVRK